MYWPDCVAGSESVGLKVDGEDVGPDYKLEDKDTCSTDCFKNASCQFWVYNAGERKCSLKKDKAGGEKTEEYYYYGQRNCFGKGSYF